MIIFSYSNQCPHLVLGPPWYGSVFSACTYLVVHWSIYLYILFSVREFIWIVAIILVIKVVKHHSRFTADFLSYIFFSFCRSLIYDGGFSFTLVDSDDRENAHTMTALFLQFGIQRIVGVWILCHETLHGPHLSHEEVFYSYLPTWKSIVKRSHLC